MELCHEEEQTPRLSPFNSEASDRRMEMQYLLLGAMGEQKFLSSPEITLVREWLFRSLMCA